MAPVNNLKKHRSVESIITGDTVIKPLESVRYLGSWFDAHMQMNVHIGKICRKAFRGLYNIRQIRKFLTMHSTKTLIHAFVSSHLDYCSEFLHVSGLPKHQLYHLQKVHNAAARVTFHIAKFNHSTPALIALFWLPVTFRVPFKSLLFVYRSLHNQGPSYITDLLFVKVHNAAARVTFHIAKFDHSTPALIKLYWLPVTFRVAFKLLLFVYKTLHNQGPSYITDLLFGKPAANCALCSSAKSLLFIAKVNCSTLGDGTFAHAAPVLWNSLPLMID